MTNPDQCGGRPSIRGIRIRVGSAFGDPVLSPRIFFERTERKRALQRDGIIEVDVRYAKRN